MAHSALLPFAFSPLAVPTGAPRARGEGQGTPKWLQLEQLGKACNIGMGGGGAGCACDGVWGVRMRKKKMDLEAARGGTLGVCARLTLRGRGDERAKQWGGGSSESWEGGGGAGGVR
jgi:hypothetical protein